MLCFVFSALVGVALWWVFSGPSCFCEYKNAKVISVPHDLVGFLLQIKRNLGSSAAGWPTFGTLESLQ